MKTHNLVQDSNFRDQTTVPRRGPSRDGDGKKMLRVRICASLAGQDDVIGSKWLLRNALSDMPMRALVLKKVDGIVRGTGIKMGGGQFKYHDGYHDGSHDGLWNLARGNCVLGIENCEIHDIGALDRKKWISILKFVSSRSRFRCCGQSDSSTWACSLMIC